MRQAFQQHALDGAVLFFHPATGTSVRVQNDATRDQRRQAPRVVMFGITNACNLRCDFCSRDRHAPSTWTLDSAAELLEGLATAGTLEVAFGGGEPFAFRGFAALVERLHQSTALALHVTTNGTLLDARTMDRLAGKLGQVRLSIYDDTPWQPAAYTLTRAKQKWGANLLVDTARLSALPTLLADLAHAGASDVSVLRYVDTDATRQLDAEGWARLAALVQESPLPARVSVCFGTSLAVPMLFDGLGPAGDCGAGLDFVSVTADGHLQACSFQGKGVPVRSAADVLAAWHQQRTFLSAPSTRAGCARNEPRTPKRVDPTPLRVWQAFSGNNSGECILVATFSTPEAATAVLAELLPGYVPGADYTEPWRALFERERVASKGVGVAPEELMSVGRTLLARTDSAIYDDFPELRALSWKRGGVVHPGFVHVHDGARLLFVVRGHDADDARSLQHAASAGGATCQPHGVHLIGVAPLGADEAPLRGAVEWVRALASARAFGCEMFEEAVTSAALLEVVKRLGEPRPLHARLVASFHGLARDPVRAQAKELHEATEESATRVEGTVLFDPAHGKKRLAVLAHRRSASVTALEGERVLVYLYFAPPKPIPRKGVRAPAAELDTEAVRAGLEARMLPGSRNRIVRVKPVPWAHGVQLVVETGEPARVMLAAKVVATAHDAELSIGMGEIDPLGAAVTRLCAEVNDR